MSRAPQRGLREELHDQRRVRQGLLGEDREQLRECLDIWGREGATVHQDCEQKLAFSEFEEKGY